MPKPARLPNLPRYQDEIERLWSLADYTIKAVSVAASVDETTFYLCDATSASFNLTLPRAARVAGRIYGLKKIDASGNAAGFASVDNIDGSGTATTTTQYATIWVISDRTTWHRLI